MLKIRNLANTKGFIVCKFFNQKCLIGGVTRARSEVSALQDTQNKSAIKNKIMPDQEVVEELHKPIITKFEKKKSISTF